MEAGYARSSLTCLPTSHISLQMNHIQEGFCISEKEGVVGRRGVGLVVTVIHKGRGVGGPCGFIAG